MTEKISKVVTNDLHELDSGVWAPLDLPEFSYSDGPSSEKYLRSVFSKTKDLSCNSVELQNHIKDWPSEYHLSQKRSQLLSGFEYNDAKSVLEVGCGCGSITRFLGEKFSAVTSVEGSLTRASLARERCRDLANVDIICSPFQTLDFCAKFDVVFCVGVLEYSASFVDSSDPYREVLKVFSQVLSPDGVLIIAIENQFGLKYLNGCREDHVGRKFEGVEGYPGSEKVVRTFGKRALHEMLDEFFVRTDFYYPYPDYKVPDWVLSDELLRSPECAELISQNRSRDYVGGRQQLWDESLTVFDLAKNEMLPFFADSFIAISSKKEKSNVGFPQQAILYSSDRRRRFNTVTRIIGLLEEMKVQKRRQNPQVSKEFDSLVLHDVDSDWISGKSLFMSIYRQCKSGTDSLDNIFSSCRIWLRHLQSVATVSSGELYVPGSLVDATWRNAYVRDDEVHFIDTEWSWGDDIRLNTLVIRSIYVFLEFSNGGRGMARPLRCRSGRKVIRNIAKSFDVELTKSDFRYFVMFEAEFQRCVRGASSNMTGRYLRLYMIDRVALRWSMQMQRCIKSLISRGIARVQRSVSSA